MEVAGFVAAWTIGYGLVQAIAPAVVRRSSDGLSREIPEARLWGTVLTGIPAVLALLLGSKLPLTPGLLVVIGLSVFGFVFAVISSLHSYLILAYAGSKKAAEDVGFYYAANAAGRLIGHRVVRGPGPIWRIVGVPLGLRRHARDLPAADVTSAGGFGNTAGGCRRLICRRHATLFQHFSKCGLKAGASLPNFDLR